VTVPKHSVRLQELYSANPALEWSLPEGQGFIINCYTIV